MDTQLTEANETWIVDDSKECIVMIMLVSKTRISYDKTFLSISCTRNANKKCTFIITDIANTAHVVDVYYDGTDDELYEIIQADPQTQIQIVDSLVGIDKKNQYSGFMQYYVECSAEVEP